MKQLEEFINRNTTHINYTNIPSYSKHYKYIKEYINEIANEYPEFTNIIEALICYPVQRWAYDVRKKLKLDSENIKELLEYGLDDYFGITNNKNLNEQKETLELSNDTLRFLSSALKEYDVLSAIHGYKQKDTNRFFMQKYYKSQLLDFCKKNNKEYLKRIKPLLEKYEKLEDDTQFVFHNASILVRLKSIIKDETSKEYNYERVVEIIEQCIMELDSYYVNDPNLRKIIYYYSNGDTEAQIARIIEKSRTYVHRLCPEGINAISYVIWGYTTRSIINNCKGN